MHVPANDPIRHEPRRLETTGATRRPPPRRLRGPRQLAMVAMAAVLLGALGARRARADLVPPGQKYIDATFELRAGDAPPDLLFVAFPYGVCYSWSDEFFRLNPHLDVAEQNYEVLRSGQRYSVHKFCPEMQIYALERSGFTLVSETLEQDLDWYRKRGLERLRVAELDSLRTTQKIDFFAHDPRVRRTGQRIDFPVTTFAASPVTATHELLRVTGLTPASVRVAPEAVVLTLFDARLVRKPYVQGERPSLELSADDFDAAEPLQCDSRLTDAQPETPEQAAGALTAPPSKRSGAVTFGASLALATAGLLGVCSRRRRRDKACGSD